MDLQYNIVGDLTFRQLKESKYYDPILTEVMFDYDMMLEMVIVSDSKYVLQIKRDQNIQISKRCEVRDLNPLLSRASS